MDTTQKTLFKYQGVAVKNVINEISLTYDTASQASLLTVANLRRKKDVNVAEDVAELSGPFTCEYWWSIYKNQDRSLISSKKEVMLNLEVHTPTYTMGFIEVLEDGITAPSGWGFDKKLLNTDRMFQISNLSAFSQSIKALEDIALVEKPTVGQIAQEIQAENKRMKFKNAPAYTIVDKVAKIASPKLLNDLPIEEKRAIVEQLVLLAMSIEHQFNNTEMAFKVIEIGCQIEGLPPEVNTSLTQAHQKLVSLENKHKKIAVAQEKKEKGIMRENFWYAVAGVLAIIYWILSEFVLD